ncbi:MAG: hypothetical protein K2N39_04340 [Lachnospiraceae bacterium]|nr:hypothetical protein [Lachnospiraceae bacterium]MDE7358652.1 hypothetical protein [Lachnospiraceae bacterium]
MAIGFVEMQGQITRAQDFTTVKHNEDTKGLVDQSNFGQQMTRQVEKQAQRVNEREKAENRQKKFDSKEKGSNEYHGDGGRNRKKQNREPDGKVLLKGMSTFDISG